jgi:hypothetical protein
MMDIEKEVKFEETLLHKKIKKNKEQFYESKSI